MATDQAIPEDYLTGNRRHRRIMYRVQMRSPFKHDRDTDVIDGVYRDPEGDTIGRLIMVEPGRPDLFLVIPEEAVPLVHVEAALEADSRAASYDRVFGLLYDPGEVPLAGVREMGDRWEAGDLVVYTFEADEEALEAQAPVLPPDRI
jgi:hypothetical protein